MCGSLALRFSWVASGGKQCKSALCAEPGLAITGQGIRWYPWLPRRGHHFTGWPGTRAIWVWSLSQAHMLEDLVTNRWLLFGMVVELLEGEASLKSGLLEEALEAYGPASIFTLCFLVWCIWRHPWQSLTTMDEATPTAMPSLLY